MRVISFHFTNWDTPYSKLIRWWRPEEEWSHVHIAVTPEIHYEVAAGSRAHWFSARNFNPAEATSHKKVSLFVEEQVYRDLVRFLNQQENTAYDWFGVIGIALGWRSLLRAPAKWYCSSLAAAAYNASIAKTGKGMQMPVKITPTEFLGYLTRRHSLPKK